MKQDELNEQLSAYLDGEVEDPEAVERLLEGEPDVRRRFEVLKRQSEAVRALPLPDVEPAFATRVLAGVREERLKRRRGWLPLVFPLAAVAAVVVVVGAVYFATQTPPRSGAPTLVADIHTLRAMEPETLDAALAQHLAAKPETMDALDPEFVGEPPGDHLDMAALLALDEMADVMKEDAELDALIDELSPDEKAVFRELLLEYAMEG